MKPYILIVEDDLDFQSYLSQILKSNGYTTKATAKGIQALEMITDHQPDLIILDLELPDMQGEGVCQEITKDYPEIPIIMLTAKSSISEKVNGLNLGADDYITKPFIPEEFLARIKARLRHKTSSDTILKIADLTLDTQKIEVKRNNQKITLSPQEFKLLEYLMQNQGIVLTREMILSRIWDNPMEVETRVVDVYIGYLRKKIDANHQKPLIHSTRGFGYSLHE